MECPTDATVKLLAGKACGALTKLHAIAGLSTKPVVIISTGLIRSKASACDGANLNKRNMG